MTHEQKIAQERAVMKATLEYFRNNVVTTDPKNRREAQRIVMEAINKVVTLEMEELGLHAGSDYGEFELNIINDSTSAITYGSQQMGRLYYLQDDPQNNSVEIAKSSIMINVNEVWNQLHSIQVDDREIACKNLFQTVFHECRHQRQRMMTLTSESSKENMMYSKEEILEELIGAKFYQDNYRTYSMEKDAEQASFRQMGEILGGPDKAKYERDATIEDGILATGQYKFDSSIEQILMEKEDKVSSEVERLLSQCDESKRIEILTIYPILQKEYNWDGTKKSVAELMKNMIKEQATIRRQVQFTVDENCKRLTNSKGMYYDMLARALEKASDKELAEVARVTSAEKLEEIFVDMKKYFQKEKQSKIKAGHKSERAKLNGKAETFRFPIHTDLLGIRVEKNGVVQRISMQEFIQTLDPQLLSQTFRIPKEPPVKLTGEEFVKKYCIRWLPSDGHVYLLNGESLSAKEYVENYMLQMGELRKDYTVGHLVMDTLCSMEVGNAFRQRCQELRTYYDGKSQSIEKVGEKIIDMAQARTAMDKTMHIGKKVFDIGKEVVDSDAFKNGVRLAVGAGKIGVGMVFGIMNGMAKDMIDRDQGMER